MDCRNVMTIKEAASLWGFSEAALRVAINNKYKKISILREGIDYRKSKGTWIITVAAMEKVYGKRE